MAHTPNSYATTPREGEDSRPASPAPDSPRPAGIRIPSLSETRVCYACGDPAFAQIDEGDGAAETWICRDCYLTEPETCDHCEEAARVGKAAVCACEKIKPPKKMRRQDTLTPPSTPCSYMEDDAE